MKKFLPFFIALVAVAAPGLSRAFETESAGISAQTPAATVRVSESGFDVHNPSAETCTVEVYAMTGRLVLREQAPSGVTSFSLTPGHYIVRVNSKATKIVIK